MLLPRARLLTSCRPVCSARLGTVALAALSAAVAAQPSDLAQQWEQERTRAVSAQDIRFALDGQQLAQAEGRTQPPADDAQQAQPARQENAEQNVSIPVAKVALFSSGVGYFEHFGQITGNADATLRFKTNQINDILKSLVLQDYDGGTVSSITYPSQMPLARILGSFQVDIGSDPSLPQLLRQLRGAEIALTLTDKQLTGIILSVDEKIRDLGDGKTQSYFLLNLISGGTIRSVELDNVRSFDLKDPKLQDELTKALAALAQARDQDKKPVTLNLRGDGERRVRFGYVVETPVWKTSYRLVLGGMAAGKELDKNQAYLQGWAIIENQTDNDWNNVQLNLISGRPISFIQPLYDPLYIPRPTVQPLLFASLRPQTYASGIDQRQEPEAFGEVLVEMDADVADRGAAQAGRARASAPGMAAKASRSTFGLRMEGQVPAPAAMPADPMNVAQSVSSMASAAQVGELFQYTVGNVSLPRQQSAMIPIVTDTVEAEKLSIYNQATLAQHPLNGARLKNTSGKHLLAGPMTVLDAGSYAGDATVDNVPPGQSRLLSYGVDLQVRVDASKQTFNSKLLTAKLVKGVLELTHQQLATQTYVIDNKSDKEKTVLVEHPKRGGEWNLVESPKPEETTEQLYRFKDTIAAGKSKELVVREQSTQYSQMTILPWDAGTLLTYSRNGEISPKVREALAEAARRKQAMTETERAIAQRDQEIQAITQEQNRIRENMRSVSNNTDYYNRLVKKLGEQETRIEQLQTQKAELTEKLDGQRREFETYVSNLNVG